MFRTGYIQSFRADLVWFLSLPILALLFAFYARDHLSALVMVSISLWITFPHHAATWVRTFGLKEDIAKYKERLIVGPIVIIGLATFGIYFTPIAFFWVVSAWDHQHSIMQQHGFARIYDFKAGTGAPGTGRWDLALNWFLFVNMLITAPLFGEFWLRMIYEYGFSISVSTVHVIQAVSYLSLAVFLCFYLTHVFRNIKQGYPINPMKYLFLGASYLMWYTVAWSTDSVLLFGVSHRIMHGIQYIVIVYLYLDNKTKSPDTNETVIKKLITYGSVPGYLLLLLGYTALYQVLRGESFNEFLFGAVAFMQPHLQAIPEHSLDAKSSSEIFSFAIYVLISTVGSIHYYYDSFIWKVRDNETQKGF